jgi:Asp-tRNA(Asn)/Glu-tRNA(Gln) amidotransferase B subunit
LLKCDTKAKLIYNSVAFASLLGFMFTGNVWIFTNMIYALIQLIKEGRISRAVGKTIAELLSKKGVEIPEELQELISE